MNPTIHHRLRRLAAAAACALAVAICIDAAAHGDPPAGEDVFDADGQWVYATNFGVIIESLPERYVCEEAFFASGDYVVAPLEVDRWVTFSSTRIAHTEDGCHFDVVESIDGLPRAVAFRPQSSEVAYVARDDGSTSLRYSDDEGRSWRGVGVDLDDVVPTGLGFLESGLVAVVAYEADDERRGIAVVAEIDVGEALRTDWPVDDELLHPELLDAGGGELLWHAGRDGERELMWSRAGGDDTEAFLSPRWPTSGAIAPDQSAAFAGGIDSDNRGVFRAERNDAAAWTEIVADHRARCMTAVDAGELLVCGHRDHDGHDLARWTEDDGELQPLVDFRDLKGYRDDCPATSPVSTHCPAIWTDTATALGIDVDDDTDAVDEHGEGGCHSTAASPTPLWLFLLVVFGVAWRRSRLGFGRLLEPTFPSRLPVS